MSHGSRSGSGEQIGIGLPSELDCAHIDAQNRSCNYWRLGIADALPESPAFDVWCEDLGHGVAELGMYLLA
jgi:hypothetical protein